MWSQECGARKENCRVRMKWDDTHGNHTAEWVACVWLEISMGGIKRIRFGSDSIQTALVSYPWWVRHRCLCFWGRASGTCIFNHVGWRPSPPPSSRVNCAFYNCTPIHNSPAPHPTHSPFPLYFLLIALIFWCLCNLLVSLLLNTFFPEYSRSSMWAKVFFLTLAYW